MLEILPLKDQKWVDHHRINKLADKLELDNIEAKIYFLRELSGIVRKLPLNIYQDPDDRLRLVEAVRNRSTKRSKKKKPFGKRRRRQRRSDKVRACV